MKTETIGIRISELEKEALKAISEKKDIPMSQIIREAIRQYLNQEATANED